jgi:hypothetical protein
VNKSKLGTIAIDAFFDNFSFAALFGKLPIPRVPRLVVDPRSLDQFLADERAQSFRDIKGEIEALVASVIARVVIDQADRLITGETLKTVLVNWSETSLKPLENVQNSR